MIKNLRKKCKTRIRTNTYSGNERRKSPVDRRYLNRWNTFINWLFIDLLRLYIFLMFCLTGWITITLYFIFKVISGAIT